MIHVDPRVVACTLHPPVFSAGRRSVPETTGEREYVNGVPVVQLKETTGSTVSSRRSSLTGPPTVSIPSPGQLPKVLSMIVDSRSGSQASLNKASVLPPIGQGMLSHSDEFPIFLYFAI